MGSKGSGTGNGSVVVKDQRDPREVEKVLNQPR